MNFLIAALFLCSAVFSFLLNKLLFKYSRNLGVHGNEDNTVIRWGSTSKPTTGGISFFITFIMSALVFFIVNGGEAGFSADLLGMLLVVTLGFLIGLSDDAYNTRPLLKFLGQVSCGVIMCLFGLHIDLFHIAPLDYALTLFWVVGIMNSINLLDNMDGVTGTISLTILATTLVMMNLYPGQAGLNPYYFILIAVAGSFIGFLILNWKPSKIYMGDTGSQFLGALLAIIGVKFFWNVDNFTGYNDPMLQVLVPVMVFLVPIMDTSFVTISRIARGQSPFVGGKDHLTHHMTHIGIPESMVPVVLGLVSLASGLLAIFLVKFAFALSNSYVIVFPIFVVTIFATFFLLYRKGERIGVMKEKYPKTFASMLNMRRNKNNKKSRQQEHTQAS